MSFLRSYYLSVVAAALLHSISSQLVKSENSRKMMHFVGSLLMVLTVISPILQIDGEDMARAITMMKLETEQIRTDIAITNRELQAEIIKLECETYILDKAKEMGLEITPEVILRDDAGVPYPYRIVIVGSFSKMDQERLGALISQDLAIPINRQEWKAD